MVNFLLTTFVIMGLVLAFISFHTSWILAKRKLSVTWIYPIVVLLTIVFATKGVIDIQGYPIPSKPEGKWEYMIHAMEGPEAVVTLKEGNEIRVYRFVPSDKEKSAMEKAKKAKDKGKRPTLKIDQPLPEMELIRLDQENPK